MAAKDGNKEIKEIAEKLDDLSKEMVDLRKQLDALDSISELEKKTDAIASSINEIKKFEKKIDGLATSKEATANSKKIDEISTALTGFEDDIQAIKEAKETEVIIKKIDDILLSMSESDVLAKKLDDLQSYVAGLSGIEEKVQDLTNQFNETNEIVGIIVRQLDDIERKYNKSIERLQETAELVEKIASQGVHVEIAEITSSKKQEKESEKAEVKEKPPVSKAQLPSTIDALMSKLLDLVNPQTEATQMAHSLEEVRDELTPMISVHTPVLFQFGKRARELKSYPPTATLNENDIASLNKEIKSWASKLKEITKSS
jgi:chromosome segregation ATPase